MRTIDDIMVMAPSSRCWSSTGVGDAVPIAETLVEGGLPVLRALAVVFGEVCFCPTGGISQETAPAWLAEPAVACVDGSWLVPRGQAVDPEAIRGRAHAAATLRSG